MKLLIDSDLQKELTKPNPIIENVPPPPGGDWFAAASAIQPSSVDLHIGEIFLPEVKDGKPGSEKCPLKNYILDAGHTAVVTTAEDCSLPNNVAGIGFPPDTVSSQGILMTNPGHIDPGYNGTLRFTLINMGRKSYSLRAGDSIVTILLFESDNAAHKGYANRHPGKIFGTSGIHRTLDSLSADFVDVEKRAKSIAKAQIVKAALTAAIAPTLASAIIALITTLLVSWLSPSWKDPVQDIKKDVAVLQAKADAVDLKTDVRVLQNKSDPAELRNQISRMQEQIAELRRQISTQKQTSGQNR